MKSKTTLVALLAVGAMAMAALWWQKSRSSTSPASAVANAPASAPRTATTPMPPAAPPSGAAAPAGASAADAGGPREILARLKALKITARQPQSARQLIVELEKLRAAGADQDYGGFARGARGQVPLDFTVPPSLRLGLFEVVKDIGGAEAEQVLAGELKATGRGVEVAYLTSALQQLAPDKYRDAALAAARELLAMPLDTAGANALDRGDREYLYGVLGSLGDKDYVTLAQSEVVRADGRVDRGALNYLQQTLGTASLDLAAQVWRDPRVTGDAREPIARLALAYTGANPKADRLYQAAINDANFSGDVRQNLIEDLNETGFADPKHLSAGDLALIQARLKLIEQLAPHTLDATNAAAFKEAYKDLVKMRDDVLRAAPPKL